MAEFDYQSYQRKRRFKRKGTQTCKEIALGVTQLLITKEEMEIYFHRFEEFFKTLKFQIRNKAEFSASINFAFPRREMLLEITPQHQFHMPWDSVNHESYFPEKKHTKIGTMQSFPSEMGSWGSSIYLRSESTDHVQTTNSVSFVVQSPICIFYFFMKILLFRIL